MKPILLLPAAFVLAIAGGALGAQFFGSQSQAASIPEPVKRDTESAQDVLQQLSILQQRLDALELKQDQWLAAPRQNVDAAVREAASGTLRGDEDASKQAAPVALLSGGKVEGPEDWFAALTTGRLSYKDSQKLWDKAVAEGRVDELIEMFEARAAADPNNPEAQNDLGQAYIQKVQTMGSSPKTGVVAVKADQAFTRALELDPNHLGARRSKAISLSFWPPMMGKQAESIQQFEILIEKQNLVPAEPDHVQAYLLLGNMHLQMGKIEEARTAWQNGLSRFPGNAELMHQLELTTDR